MYSEFKRESQTTAVVIKAKQNKSSQISNN